MKGRNQERIELLGKITIENLYIWEEEAIEAKKSKHTLLVFKFPRLVKPTYLESVFNLLDRAKKPISRKKS